MNHSQKVKILYKSILKLHKGLPKELQLMGNEYVRDEFKRHSKLNIEKDQKIITTFMWEWTDYAITLAKQLGIKGIQREERLGKNLDESQLSYLNDEQSVQLYELYLASKGGIDCEEKQKS
ncbi:hypothetical protein PVAND_011617 [Polypedilum vanderplanki]|uniref:Succinate dehydrogenase assembly factor 3 n=1 Tax=Polypedilum vanderplanki TaxID=319348 RepID=A0A9J6CJW2_POLVA|nr:hypothetical protein PVAND_011617 [Polypedilum vanderplanki]